MKSWETSLGGIVAAAAAVLAVVSKVLNGETPSQEEWLMIAGLVGASWTGFRARDNNKASRIVGAE